MAAKDVERARVRFPPPLLPRRMASGRGATEQPNATGDGALDLSPRFWLVLLATGVATGLFAVALMFVLHLTQRIAFGSPRGSFEASVIHAGGARRLAALAVVGAVVGPAWWLLRRRLHQESTDLDDALWTGSSRLGLRRCLGTSLLSEVAVGGGASLGREAAPKLMGAVSGSVLAGWAGLSAPQQRLLMACGGGAGMAAVYNVPLGGAVLAAEVLFGALSLPVILPALACSVVATVVGWLTLPEHATYPGIPAYHVAAPQIVFAVIAGPLLGLLSVGWVRLIGAVSALRPAGWLMWLAPVAAFTLLGLLGLHYPQLLGNGQDMAGDAFVGAGGIGLVLVLALLKPLVTALCLGSGASGGLLTPTLSLGAVAGAAMGIGWSHLWSGSAVGAYALIGAVAMLGAGLQGPLSALVLVLELTRSSDSLAVPMLIATVLATLVARWLDGYSIYSARLPAQRAG